MLLNLARAGLARVRNVPYAPLPTAYDALFPGGTPLTAPRPARVFPAEPDDGRPAKDGARPAPIAPAEPDDAGPPSAGAHPIP